MRARLRVGLCCTNEVAYHQRSNPSIERTSSSVLRTLPAAAHVKR